MATITADSVSRTDVNTAITAAANGDTVVIPSGSANWATGITVNKSIIIQGAGSSSTVLTNTGSSGEFLFNITPANNTDLCVVTGIGFSLGSLNSGKGAIYIQGNPETAFTPTKVRVNHNAFTGGGGNPGVIVTYGEVYGVIDHNTFLNSYSGVFGWGAFYQETAWINAYNAGDIFAGTANAMFVEDNTFTYTGTGITADASIYIQQGSSYVVRYNTFDASACIDPNVIELMYNHHGNQEYGHAGFRGQPIFESYNNTAIGCNGNCEFMSMRGGSCLIHDETFTSAGTPGARVKFDEEEAWQTAFFSPLRTVWPAQDQVMNSFVWNVSYNGTDITDVTIADDNGGAVNTFIQKDRDYFMHAPQASGGRETYTGTRFGGSTTSPTGTDTGSMTFSSSGANAYYPYTPYTYPHPLRGEAATRPLHGSNTLLSIHL